MGGGSGSVVFDTLSLGITMSFNQGMDIIIYYVLSDSLRDITYDRSFKTYVNGDFYGWWDMVATGNYVSGDLIKGELFLMTTEGVKYYSETWVVP